MIKIIHETSAMNNASADLPFYEKSVIQCLKIADEKKAIAQFVAVYKNYKLYLQGIPTIEEQNVDSIRTQYWTQEKIIREAQWPNSQNLGHPANAEFSSSSNNAEYDNFYVLADDD